jgi:hypothetical protein
MSRAGGPVIYNHGVLASAPRAYAHQFNALADRQPDDGRQSRNREAQGKRSERIKAESAPRSTPAGGPRCAWQHRAPRDGSNGLARPADPPRGHSVVDPPFWQIAHNGAGGTKRRRRRSTCIASASSGQRFRKMGERQNTRKFGRARRF